MENRAADRAGLLRTANECSDPAPSTPDQCLLCLRGAKPILASLRAVIGMAGQDGRGPINLFQKHDPYHLMRPGRSAERHAQLGLAPQIARKSVRAAYRANSITVLLIPPAARQACKTAAI